ncbi:hypothetical protein DFP72DRAFT_841280 [Ephemerocybe angulata]|uniref:Uncharacterized protein n=1 Tax=Ephemerocybe angulata TaxID=980116 RepID=A0A8H6IF01_9AGAR|nr:hypothetical protein DFP72DRAFT_841280 [Tulosesus angulatus]
MLRGNGNGKLAVQPIRLTLYFKVVHESHRSDRNNHRFWGLKYPEVVEKLVSRIDCYSVYAPLLPRTNWIEGLFDGLPGRLLNSAGVRPHTIGIHLIPFWSTIAWYLWSAPQANKTKDLELMISTVVSPGYFVAVAIKLRAHGRLLHQKSLITRSATQTQGERRTSYVMVHLDPGPSLPAEMQGGVPTKRAKKARRRPPLLAGLLLVTGQESRAPRAVAPSELLSAEMQVLINRWGARTDLLGADMIQQQNQDINPNCCKQGTWRSVISDERKPNR